MSIAVLKIGGSCLTGEEAVREITSLLAARIRAGEKIVVVVSALKGVTDALVREAQEKGIAHDPVMLDACISRGEITSAQLLTEKMRAEGVSVACIEPCAKEWPVITDGVHGDAEPLIPETEERVQQHILPLIERGITPIVCGFVGKTKRGAITTMGRGGSDATAVLLGRALRAKEVVLLKDVDGLHTADPKKNPGAKPIPRMHAAEALRLVEGGAKIIQEKALRLKAADVPLLVIGNGSGIGTIIEGAVDGGEAVGVSA